MHIRAIIMGIFLTACAGEGMRPDDFVPGDMDDTTVDSDQRGGYETDSDTDTDIVIFDTAFDTGLIPDSDTGAVETDSDDSDTDDFDTGATWDSDDSDALDSDTDQSEPLGDVFFTPTSQIAASVVVSRDEYELILQDEVVATGEEATITDLSVEFDSPDAVRMYESVYVEVFVSNGELYDGWAFVTGTTVSIENIDAVVPAGETALVSVLADISDHATSGFGDGVSGDMAAARIADVIAIGSDSGYEYTVSGLYGETMYYYESETFLALSAFSPQTAVPASGEELIRVIAAAHHNEDVELSSLTFEMTTYAPSGWADCNRMMPSFVIKDQLTGVDLMASVTLLKFDGQPCDGTPTPVAYVVLEFSETIAAGVAEAMSVEGNLTGASQGDVVHMRLSRVVWSDTHESADSMDVPTEGVSKILPGSTYVEQTVNIQ
jgi:hypothetical protein